MLHPMPLCNLTIEHDTLLQMVVTMTFKYPNLSQISNFNCSKNSLSWGHNTAEFLYSEDESVEPPSSTINLPYYLFFLKTWNPEKLNCTVILSSFGFPKEMRKIFAQNMRLKFLTYRQSQIYIFTHVHKEVNTFMNSDSVAKKKSKYCRFVSWFSWLPESSGSTFTALVSSAKFDFKLPEVKEGLYSINTRSSHTFLKLLHSLLSKITILSSAGRLQFSFTGRDGQRMSSSRRRAFCFASPLPPAFLQRRCNKSAPATYKPLYTLALCRIRPLHQWHGDSPHLAAVERLRCSYRGPRTAQHAPTPQIIGTCV